MIKAFQFRKQGVISFSSLFFCSWCVNTNRQLLFLHIPTVHKHIYVFTYSAFTTEGILQRGLYIVCQPARAKQCHTPLRSFLSSGIHLFFFFLCPEINKADKSWLVTLDCTALLRCIVGHVHYV